jgi:isopenicillin-N epimerase
MKPLTSFSRRTFFKQISGACATTVFAPVLGETSQKIEDYRLLFPNLATSGNVPDEKYWEMGKKQFKVPTHLLMVNAANLCPSPYLINDTMLSFTKSLEKDVSFQNRAQFEEIRKKAIDQLAQFVNVSREEIGITRNTTESNNTIVNGLDFKKETK